MFYLPEIDFIVRYDEPSIAKFLSRNQHGYIMLIADDSNIITSNAMYIGCSDEGYFGTYTDQMHLQKMLGFDNNKISSYTDLTVSNYVLSSSSAKIQNFNHLFLAEHSTIYLNNLDARIQHDSNISFLKSNHTSLAMNAKLLKLIDEAGNYSLLSPENGCILNSYDHDNNLISAIDFPSLSTTTFATGCNLFMTKNAVKNFIFPESSYFLDETSNDQITRYLNYSNIFTNTLDKIYNSSSNDIRHITNFVNYFQIDIPAYHDMIMNKSNIIDNNIIFSSNELLTHIQKTVLDTNYVIQTYSNHLFDLLYQETSNQNANAIENFYNSSINTIVMTSNFLISTMLLDTSNYNKYLLYEFKQADRKADSSGNNRSLTTTYNVNYQYNEYIDMDSILMNAKSFASLPVANFYDFNYLSIHTWIKPNNLALNDHIFYYNIFENSVRYPKQTLNAPSITNSSGITIRTAESSSTDIYRSWRLYDDLRWGVETDSAAPGYMTAADSYDRSSGLAKNILNYFSNDTSYYGEWFMIDLGENIFLEKYKFYLNNSSTTGCPNSFSLYASDHPNAWNNPRHYSWKQIHNKTDVIDYRIYTVNEFIIPETYQKKSFRFFAVIVHKIQLNNGGFMNLTQVDFNGNKDSSILIQNVENSLVFSVNSQVLYTYPYTNNDWFYLTWNIFNGGNTGYVKINNGAKNYFNISKFTKPTATTYVCRLANLYNTGTFNLSAFFIADYKLPKTVLEDAFDALHIPALNYIENNKMQLYANNTFTSNQLFPEINQMDVRIKNWLGVYTRSMSNMIMQHLNATSNQVVRFYDTTYHYSDTSNYVQYIINDNFKSRISDVSNVQNTNIDVLTIDRLKTGSSKHIISNNVYTNNLKTNAILTKGNVVPFKNRQFDLGSSTTRWEDVYVTSNSIYLGENRLSFDIISNGLTCTPSEFLISKIKLFDSYSVAFTELEIEKGQLSLKSYNTFGILNPNVFRIKTLDSVVEGTSNIFYKKAYAENIISTSNDYNITYVRSMENNLNEYINSYNADLIVDGMIHDNIYDKSVIVGGMLTVTGKLNVTNKYILYIYPISYEIETVEITANMIPAFKILQTGTASIINLANVLMVNNQGNCGINKDANEKIDVNGNLFFSGTINDITSNTINYLSGTLGKIQDQIMTNSNNVLKYTDFSCNQHMKDLNETELVIHSNIDRKILDNYAYFAMTCNYNDDFVKAMNSNVLSFELNASNYVLNISNLITDTIRHTSNHVMMHLVASDIDTSNYFKLTSNDLCIYSDKISSDLSGHLDGIIKNVIGWDAINGFTFNDFYNVGIGVSMPNVKLDIAGSLQITDGLLNSTKPVEIESMSGLRYYIQQQINDLNRDTSNYIYSLDVGFHIASNTLNHIVTTNDLNMSNNVQYHVEMIQDSVLNTSNRIDDVIKRFDERKLWYTMNDDNISFMNTVVIGRNIAENSNANRLELYNSNLTIFDGNANIVQFRPIPNIHPSITENGVSTTSYRRILGNTYYHTFTSNGSITFHHDTECDVFLIGGGGSGGGTIGGGGGSGACVISMGYTFTPGTYDIVVGQGGLGVQFNDFGQNGEDSKIGNIFIAKGGGGGGKFNNSGKTGGSSGGSGADYAGPTDYVLLTNVVNGNIISGPVVNINYAVLGNIGGTSVESTGDNNELNAGGGGGIGSFGVSGTLASVGAGGSGAYQVILQNGMTYNFKEYFSPLSDFGIMHNDKFYIGGGGGGGGYQDSPIIINGGYGGGGSGIDATGPAGANGMPNTGSGGGAISYNQDQSGAYIVSGSGGSGLVIIRYTLSLGKEPVPQTLGIHRWSDSTNNIIYGDGLLAINKVSSPDTKLHVGVGADSIQGLYRYFSVNNNNLSSVSEAKIVDGICSVFESSVLVSGNISATSDSRIKKDIIDIDDHSALKSIMEIQPKTYQYIDVASRGSNLVYGFIAQNIREILPHAVRLHVDVIPNIYRYADIQYDTIYISDHHVIIGDMVYIIDMLNHGDEYKVIAVAEHTITIDRMIEGDQVFVYGKKVEDFHVLDKSSVYTMNVCATQILADKIQNLKKRLQEIV